MDDNYESPSSYSRRFNEAYIRRSNDDYYYSKTRKRNKDNTYCPPSYNTEVSVNRGNRRFSWIPSYVVLVLIFYTTLVKFVLVGLAKMH